MRKDPDLRRRSFVVLSPGGSLGPLAARVLTTIPIVHPEESIDARLGTWQYGGSPGPWFAIVVRRGGSDHDGQDSTRSVSGEPSCRRMFMSVRVNTRTSIVTAIGKISWKGASRRDSRCSSDWAFRIFSGVTRCLFYMVTSTWVATLSQTSRTECPSPLAQWPSNLPSSCDNTSSVRPELRTCQLLSRLALDEGPWGGGDTVVRCVPPELAYGVEMDACK